MRVRRSFTPEFKAEVVALARRGDRSIGQISQDMDLVESVIRRWVAQADVDEGRRPTTSTEQEEIMALRKRGARVLEEEREILKKAARFFATRPGEPVSVHRGGETDAPGQSAVSCA